MTKQTTAKLRELDDIQSEVISIHLKLIRLWQQADAADLLDTTQELDCLKRDVQWARRSIRAERVRILGGHN